MQARLELMALGKIRAAKRNPKQHDLEGIELSIRRFGFCDFPTINEKTKRLVEGHGRLITLKTIKRDGPKPELDASWPPQNVVIKGRMWSIPIVRGMSWATDAEASAYLAAHNQLNMNAGWDDKELAALLTDVQSTPHQLTGLGFDDDFVAGLMASVDEGAGDVTPPSGPSDPGEAMKFAHECPKCGHTFK